MPQHLPDSIRIIRVSGERVRASALVARPSQNATPTTVRVPTRVGISVGDKVDARPGLVTVSATASTGQDLTDGITVATVS